MAISITKVVEEVAKTQCSNHDVSIVDGTVGMILVQCSHCKRRWLGKELDNGTTEVNSISDTYELPKLAKAKKEVAEKPKQNRDIGVIKNPMLDKLNEK